MEGHQFLNCPLKLKWFLIFIRPWIRPKYLHSPMIVDKSFSHVLALNIFCIDEYVIPISLQFVHLIYIYFLVKLKKLIQTIL